MGSNYSFMYHKKTSTGNGNENMREQARLSSIRGAPLPPEIMKVKRKASMSQLSTKTTTKGKGMYEVAMFYIITNTQ